MRTFINHELYRQRSIPYIEERLYLIDLLRDHMDYDQAETFLQTLKKIFIIELNDEEKD